MSDDKGKRPSSLFDTPENGYHEADDARPCPDMEDDHSDPGYDVAAEIESRLGPKSEAGPLPDAVAETGGSGTRPAATPQSPVPGPSNDESASSEDVFDDAEDVRPCPDMEDDHSDPGYDVAVEIESRLGPARAAPLSPVAAAPVLSSPAPENGAESAEALFPEFVRPCPENEDDHSDAEVDLDAEIERLLGPAPPPASTPELDALNASSDVHPGLKAALAASYAHATMETAGEAAKKSSGLADGHAPDSLNDGGAENLRNKNGLGVEDDSRCPLDPEDEGEDDCPPLVTPVPDAAAGSLSGAASPSVPAAAEDDEGGKKNGCKETGDDKTEHAGTEDGADAQDDDDEDDDEDENGMDENGDEDEEDDDDDGPEGSGGTGADGRNKVARKRKGLYYGCLLTAFPFLIGALFADFIFPRLPQSVSSLLPQSELLGNAPPQTVFVWACAFVTGVFVLAALYMFFLIASGSKARGLPPRTASSGGHSLRPSSNAKDGGNENKDQEDNGRESDRAMEFADHFRELRKRLFRAFLLLLAGFFLCWPFAEELFSLLTRPLLNAMPENSSFIFTSPPEAFFVYMKVAMVAGFFVTSPFIFYQIWAFIAPGLYKEEKIYILPVAFFSALFFISGGAFCYFVVFPFAFEFFMSYNTGIIQAMPALSETLSFVLKLLLAFGLVFEMPLFAFFLARMGILTADMMRRSRRYAILIMFIVAAILTPPDVLSQLLMAGPLLLLYELSIYIAAVFGRKKPKNTEDEDDEDEDEEEEGASAATLRPTR